MQRRYKNGIWYLKMCHSIAAKRKENKVGRNSTTDWRGNKWSRCWGYKYLGVLEIDKMCDEMKRKVKEVYQKRVKLLMKTHLNGKNLFQALNTWAISVIRYSAAFLDWTKEETKELDRWTRKQLIAGRALHSQSNMMRIYIKRRYGGRGLISVEECCAAELRSIDYYLANSEEELLKVVTKIVSNFRKIRKR